MQISTFNRNEKQIHADDKLSREASITIAILVISTFTVILNEMLMAVALPKVMVDLDISATTAQWLTTGYMLTMAVVIPATGFLTQRLQMRSVFTLAMALFTIGTVVAIFSSSFSVLLFARVVQAIGTAIVTPLAFTAVSSLVPNSRKGRIMALVTAATALAPSIGPLASGLILSVANWNWIFIAILPIALLSLILSNRMISVESSIHKTKLDVLSLILSAVGFASLVYGLASLGEGSQHAIINPWVSFFSGITIVTLFVIRQLILQRSDRALLDMRPFSIRLFTVSALTMICFMTAGYGMMTLLPVILQTSYGFSPVQAGLLMMPGGIIVAIVSSIVGKLYDKMGAKSLVISGAVIDFLGHYCLSTLAPGSSIGFFVAAYLLVNIGQALMWTPVFAASLGALHKEMVPHGSAILNTLGQLAGAAGIAIAFSIMGSQSAVYIDSGEAVDKAMALGAQKSYLVCSILAICAAVLGAFLPKHQPS